jgi:hypothetical protein
LDRRQGETLNYYQMRVDKCKYEAELARRRFMRVDPDNRLVALELESSWNIQLKEYDEARDEYSRQSEKLVRASSAHDYSALSNLAESFANTFRSDAVSWKDKKRMVRYLIEDVTLTRASSHISMQIRYRGHTTQSVIVAAPKRICETWSTPPKTIELINSAAETASAEGIAVFLNQQKLKSGKGCGFTANIVKRIMYAHSIPSMKERYLNRGYMTCVQKAKMLGISTAALMSQVRLGKYRGEVVRVNSRNECVFPPEKE